MEKRSEFSVKAWVVDVFHRRISPAEIVVAQTGRIRRIRPVRESEVRGYVLPGFVNAHVHIESTLLAPREAARLMAVHGTVGTVSDPHEIANVLGVDGVRYMLEQGKSSPVKMAFGAPSCVPATPFETAGAVLSAEDVAKLLEDPQVYYLSEVMNFPGVLAGDKNLRAMIAAAKRLGKPVDGHAPGMRGEDVLRYAGAGIATDHECFTREEALDKIHAGMKILIREGSAAKNFDALIDLLRDFPDKIMFCTDDSHPDFLAEGDIVRHVRRAVAHGLDLYDVLRAASVNPVEHYRLPVGLLREGDPADFITVDNLSDFNVQATYIDGVKVAEHGRALFDHQRPPVVNNFNRGPISVEDVQLERDGDNLRVIKVIPGQLVTDEAIFPVTKRTRYVVSDPENDVLKLVVVNRYRPDEPVAVSFVHGFGLRSGALASTVAHDSHNVIAVGVTDADIVRAINLVIAAGGGLSYSNGSEEQLLPLPIAGLMSGDEGHHVARQYSELDRYAKQSLQSPLPAPFMSLSFLALLVIPALKLSDKGLFDGRNFAFVTQFAASA